MALTAAEQYLIELINRARLDPTAEVARYGVGLNTGLNPGTIDGTSKQPLAYDPTLDASATGHSLWMLANDIFSHTGAGGSSPYQRAMAAGFSGYGVGENISWRGSTGSINANSLIGQQHGDLVVSAGHRVNIMSPTYTLIGVSQEVGVFTSGRNFNASMVTENFGRTTQNYLTGVTFTDTDRDDFYSIGEATGGTSFTVGGRTVRSSDTGGYTALLPDTDGPIKVAGVVNGKKFSVLVDGDGENIKLDLINGRYWASSADITLGGGIQVVRLLGAANLNATGNVANNDLIGNRGANVLNGLAGDDRLFGRLGYDTLYGADGNDTLMGEAGCDVLNGGGGNDVLNGGADGDRLLGGIGDDMLIGGLGPDTFIFAPGAGDDVIADFSRAERDVLRFDDALWSNQRLTAEEVVQRYASVEGGDVVFSFADGTSVRLDGVTTTTGLAAVIEIV